MTQEKEKKIKTRNEDDVKIYVRFAKDILEQVDDMAKVYGMSRSSLIAYYVGKMVKQDKLQQEALNEALKPENVALLIKATGLDINSFKDSKMR